MPNPNPNSLPWEELERRGASAALPAPAFAARVLAETARLRGEAAAARESARVMVVAAFALSALLLGYVEFDARQASTAADARAEEWNGLAQWVATLE
ncbi:MAG TPA: hypothetical protein VIM58_01770 [Candidatus Methylacidiphilales bacterium]